MDDFKFLADLIQHIPLPLRARYVLCCSPINKKMPFVCAMFLKVRPLIVFEFLIYFFNLLIYLFFFFFFFLLFP